MECIFTCNSIQFFITHSMILPICMVLTVSQYTRLIHSFSPIRAACPLGARHTRTKSPTPPQGHRRRNNARNRRPRRTPARQSHHRRTDGKARFHRIRVGSHGTEDGVGRSVSGACGILRGAWQVSESVDGERGSGERVRLCGPRYRFVYALFLCCSRYKLCLYLCALSVGAQTKEGVCEGRCELYEV